MRSLKKSSSSLPNVFKTSFFSFAFLSPQVVSGDSLGHVQLWDGRHGTLLKSFSQHTADVTTLAIDGQERCEHHFFFIIIFERMFEFYLWKSFESFLIFLFYLFFFFHLSLLLFFLFFFFSSILYISCILTGASLHQVLIIRSLCFVASAMSWK